MSSDAMTIRIALILLGLITLTCLIAGTVTVLNDKSLPDALIGIGSSSATALGLIISRPMGGTQNVRVVDEPIAVTETPAVPTRSRKKS